MFIVSCVPGMALNLSCCSVAQLCPTLGDPMDCSMPVSPAFHCLLEFAQTLVHWVNDAIQPSHVLSYLLFMTVMMWLFSSVQLLSHVRLFATSETAAHQASLSITNFRSLLKFLSIEWVMPSNHLVLCRPLLLPSIFPSFRVFSKESVLCIRWPKYWSFSFSISPSNDYSGLISFRMDWLDLLVVQGTLKNLLQHHSSKASILWHSAYFTVQLSHPYITTGKNHSLDQMDLCWQSDVSAF